MRTLWVNRLLALVFALAASWLLAPSRNAAGNPAFEERQDACTDPSTGTSFALYRGNGGATTAFWYSLTSDPSGLPAERQVFYSYSTPVVTAINCAPGSLELVAEPSNIIIEADRIAELRKNPLAYYRGESWAPPPIQPYRLVPLTAGFVCLLLFLKFAARMRRARKPRRLTRRCS